MPATGSVPAMDRSNHASEPNLIPPRPSRVPTGSLLGRPTIRTVACRRSWHGAAAGVLVAALAAAGCGDGRGVATAPEPLISTPAHSFDLEPVVRGLDRPTFVGAAPGDAGVLWVLEQAGRVLRIVDGRPAVALDITDDIRLGVETGLLGMAFHPRFTTNRRVFLHFTNAAGDTRVAEFRGSPDGTAIQPGPVRTLLAVDQPEANHNGGQVAFGPDGRLYLGLGDGGGAFDPRGAAQDPDDLLGKLLAADVDLARPTWEVVLTGLRNPWRFSFDPALADVWIGDVGQDQVEEVNRVQLDPTRPPKNLGWSAYEGTRRLEGKDLLGDGDLVFPVASYTHEQGCSVVGGLVYSAARFPALVRRYFFGDFCTGTLWSLVARSAGEAGEVRQEAAKVPQLTHIGTDSDGELVFASAAGTVYKAILATP